MIRALLIFVVANLVLAGLSGVRTGGDSGVFLDGARRLLDGLPLVDREPSYAGYAVVIAVIQALGGGLRAVVVVQVIAATFAAAAVYRLATELAGPTAGWVATSLFALDIETNRWHTFVLSDSLYLSLLACAVWLVHHAAAEPRPARYGAAVVTLLAASFVRPEGWFVLPAAGLYWIVRGTERPASRLMAGLALAAVSAMLVLSVSERVSGNLSAVGPTEMLRRGQTIWDYDGWRVAMPDAGVQATGESAAAFARRYPLATAKLMAARVVVHFAHVRPFYSLPHNIAIVVWLVPVYLCAGVAVWRCRRHPLALWCLTAVASQTLVVALTHAESDGRYLAHVLPLVYPLTAAGVLSLVRRTRVEAIAA